MNMSEEQEYLVVTTVGLPRQLRTYIGTPGYILPKLTAGFKDVFPSAFLQFVSRAEQGEVYTTFLHKTEEGLKSMVFARLR